MTRKGSEQMKKERINANEVFARKATALKNQHDVTLTEISEGTGITTSALHGYLGGYRRVTFKAAILIANYFKVPITEFIEDEEAQ